MKAIRATQSESWHTSFERENVHNSSRCSMKLPGRRGLPGTPAICIRVPRSELLYSHSLLRFLQVFSHLVVKCFMPAPSSLGMSRTTPFSNKRSNAASVLVTSRSGSTLQGCPSFNQLFHRDGTGAAISRFWLESHLLLLRQLTRKSVRLTDFTLLDGLLGLLAVWSHPRRNTFKFQTLSHSMSCIY